ncbi:MAG: hypothetical protein IJ083_08575 [Clostridia bacterium]|nr:hypothetical protein [Clostridia bacterium]
MKTTAALQRWDLNVLMAKLLLCDKMTYEERGELLVAMSQYLLFGEIDESMLKNKSINACWIAIWQYLTDPVYQREARWLRRDMNQSARESDAVISDSRKETEQADAPFYIHDLWLTREIADLVLLDLLTKEERGRVLTAMCQYVLGGKVQEGVLNSGITVTFWQCILDSLKHPKPSAARSERAMRQAEGRRSRVTGFQWAELTNELPLSLLHDLQAYDMSEKVLTVICHHMERRELQESVLNTFLVQMCYERIAKKVGLL